MKAKTHLLLRLTVLWSLISAASLPGFTNAAETGPAPRKVKAFALKDQYDAPHMISFPGTNVLVMTVADRNGSEQVEGWIAPLKKRYAGRIDIMGIADLGKVPRPLRGLVQSKFKQQHVHPVMLDWSGEVAGSFGYAKNEVSLFVIHRDGTELLHLSGATSEEKLKQVFTVLDRVQPLPPPREK